MKEEAEKFFNTDNQRSHVIHDDVDVFNKNNMIEFAAEFASKNLEDIKDIITSENSGDSAEKRLKEILKIIKDQ